MMLTKARITVLDGAEAGLTLEVQTRDLSMSGICFLLKQELRVGQTCRIDIPGQKARTAEVIRSRTLSTGKFEMALQYRA